MPCLAVVPCGNVLNGSKCVFSPKTFQLEVRGDRAEVYGLSEKCTLKTKGKGGEKVFVKVLLPHLINAAPGGLRGTGFGEKGVLLSPGVSFGVTGFGVFPARQCKRGHGSTDGGNEAAGKAMPCSQAPPPPAPTGLLITQHKSPWADVPARRRGEAQKYPWGPNPISVAIYGGQEAGIVRVPCKASGSQMRSAWAA